MELSISGGGGQFTSIAKYAGVYAPNAAKQTVSANTPTTIVLNTEIYDYDGIASLSGNQVTIPSAGIYWIGAIIPFQNDTANYDEVLAHIYDSVNTGVNNGVVASIQGGSYIGRVGQPWAFGEWYKTSGSVTVEIKIESSLAGKIGSVYTGTGLTNSSTGLAWRGQLFIGKK